MTLEQFTQLAAEGYNRIPIKKEVLADLDTPLSAYLKLASGPYSYLLESVFGGEKWGRYSIIGLPAEQIVLVKGYNIFVYHKNNLIEKVYNEAPLAWIADFTKRFRVPPIFNELHFTGGLVGYFAYDTVRYIEPRLAQSKKKNPLDTPDILLMVSDELLVFDNLKGKLYIIVHADPQKPGAYADAVKRLDSLATRLRSPMCSVSKPYVQSSVHESDFKSNFSRSAFIDAVKRIKEYIAQGDVMQVVLSQRLEIAYEQPPLNIYRALRSLNPSPYMYYLDLNDFHIVGSSPEILVRKRASTITVRPIAGTRPRGRNEAEDLNLEQELLADNKERAEHLMLIDLGRNDIGRVAQIGSVQLTEKMVIERYSHVMHIVSNVEGQLKPELNALSVLQATFPAGTLSGAPKIRAMEIIDELEPIKRGVYGGAIGYLTWHGDIDTAIAIRTAVIKNQTLSVQVGAGIVADSKPANEWEETMSKGRALFKACAMAAAEDFF
ncbi:MAG: anthranilate synthase component I [Candidatus Parabeggiatoa sp. nov. 1]|nr:MAG: anthranilate synthase component I [Gammaproteobacteria bacterium]